ncbi:MAG: Holo-(acyl-carrier-protein) synthase [Firmicutes bacterium ADurb.Bin300]|nr:MAG: Holo-(acyl-carrier-protein) synthase [Firmicutes bacterium ADurb.Bin300]
MVVGIDSIEIDSIEKSVKSKRFVERVYGPNEQAELQGVPDSARAQRCAALFAAKEAFSKALGTGVRGFSLSQVEVLHENSGKPYLFLSGNAKEIAEETGYSFSVSITHTKSVATAIVIGYK